MNDIKIIPTNIVSTYPVKWNKYQVLRDFVQNFYDEVDANSWEDEFKYSYDKSMNLLTMEISNHGFSYEWLLHIGASTKSETQNKFAGFYGEGFKIAAACFSHALTTAIEMLIDETDLLKTMRQQWIKVFRI